MSARRSTVPVHQLRVAGGVMLAAAAVLPGGIGLPCPLRTLTGVPCPLCGMTRSVTATVHLRIDDALALNPAGVVAVAVALGLLVAWRLKAVTLPRLAMPAAVAALWAWQLLRYPTT